jgi:site-specific recombinase XerD
MNASQPTLLAHSLRRFFTDYLPGLRGMSPHTVQSYRDTWVLVLRFLTDSRGVDPAKLAFEHLQPDDVLAFLASLEAQRHNSPATRNVRLAAVHAFFRYVAAQYPEYLAQAQRIIGLPFKRTGSRPIDYLDYDEIQAVLDSIDRNTVAGRRDYALLATMFNTGARVQEIVDLRICHLQLIRPFQVQLHGKGRKVRYCPLWPQTAAVLRDYCTERQLELTSQVPLFFNQRGQPLTRFGVRYILARHCQRASRTQPSLASKRLHPHSMRHSTAVHMLKSGVDLVTISHWLGHASANTTHRYAVLDMEMKRAAIAQAQIPYEGEPALGVWKQDASILKWLEAL